MPVRVAPEEFDRLVEKAVERIPARFRRRMANIALIVEARPTPEQLAGQGLRRPATLLGLYQGRPLSSRSVFESFAMPDRILIFQQPHEDIARDLDHLAGLVEETVWHEIAHYFGMEEEQVRAAERRRRARARLRR